uniref:Secreted protein n=1 Tax=Anopheles darlingi TaxID=43151 RepID=A0A2M4DRP8_ANODA
MVYWQTLPLVHFSCVATTTVAAAAAAQAMVQVWRIHFRLLMTIHPAAYVSGAKKRNMTWWEAVNRCASSSYCCHHLTPLLSVYPHRKLSVARIVPGLAVTILAAVTSAAVTKV